MKKVRIEPGCTACGLCEFLVPEIFEVKDISRVKENAAITSCLDRVEQAARACPVQVIVVDDSIAEK